MSCPFLNGLHRPTLFISVFKNASFNIKIVFNFMIFHKFSHLDDYFKCLVNSLSYIYTLRYTCIIYKWYGLGTRVS